MSAIIIQDEIVHYEALGRGRPVLFLHSWVGSWRYWIPSMQATSVSFRAYALDLWGFGDTANKPDNYTLESQAELLNSFLDTMGIGKIALIGHGLGAVVAVIFAQKYPQYVDRVLTIGLPFRPDLIDSRFGNITPEELASWILSATPNGDQVRQDASKIDPKAITQSLENIQNTNLHLLSHQLSPSCLFVNGENDLAVQLPPTQLSNTLPRHLHHISLEGAGHFPMLDEPNKFNRLMNDFLTLASGQSLRQLTIKEEWKRRVR